MPHTIFVAVIIIICFGFLLSKVLDFLNMKTWSKDFPSDLSEFYSPEQYQKAREYHFAKEKLSLLSDSISFVITLGFVLFQGFAWLDQLLNPYFSNPLLLALAFFGLIYIVNDLLSIPFSLYNIFVIEEKFGFNKTTVKTYILDKLKSYLLIIIIGGGISTLLLFLILWLKEDFWLVAFVVVVFFSLFFSMFYTTLITPLFNKLTPLPDGELRQAIETYAAKVSFPLKNVFVIDGSKRSSKANAFFTGLWRQKKIVLYDTLIEKHSVGELVGVLAHEVGHYKKKHVAKGLLSSFIQTFVMLYVLSLVLFRAEFSQAFGVQSDQYVLHINLIVIAMLFEPISLITGLIGSVFSRKHEYQADNYAITTTGNKSLMQALKGLSTTHLSNLKPHPAYVFFYYSHPPLLQRLAAMDKIPINQ